MNKGERIELKVGDRIWFEGEVKPYRVKAACDRFAICTKPFNLMHCALYTIIDWERMVRGRNNLIFNSYDYMVPDDINECLLDLQSGEIEVSRRNKVPLEITRHDNGK